MNPLDDYLHLERALIDWQTEEGLKWNKHRDMTQFRAAQAQTVRSFLKSAAGKRYIDAIIAEAGK